MKNVIKILLLSSSLSGFTQLPIEPDSIALVEDQFQEYFYEALKQKGIENYDRAIENLEKALQIKPQEKMLLHEIGKNYYFSKKYPQAEEYIQKAIAQDPNNKWYNLSLYDVYYATQDYYKSIDLLQKLIVINSKQKLEYQDDLVSLYMHTQQFDKALKLIDELDKTAAYDQTREMYKLQIQRSNMNHSGISDLEKEIKANPKNEQAYVNLIYRYSENNQDDKAFQVAKLLAKNIPDSDWAHVSLFKFYLEDNAMDKAISSMYKVFESQKVDNKIKHRVLNEFLIFVNDNPQYDKELQKAVSYFSNEPNVSVAKEIGKFFYVKKDFKDAANYFETSLKNNPNDLETIILLFESYTENAEFDKLRQQSDNYMELFPLQPELLYYNGLAYYGLKNYKKAQSALEEGLDYLVDNKTLELKFYQLLADVYSGAGNQKEKQKYQQKADVLKKNLK